MYGVIPAKGTSAGLPGKNMKVVAGHPTIHFMLKSALNAASLGKVWVSTENGDIESYCSQEGAKVFRHDPRLSGETSSTFGVIANIVHYWKELGEQPDIVITMRATSPLCLASDIDKAIEMLIKSKADSVVAVTRSDVHPYRILTINKSGLLSHFDERSPEKNHPIRRQELSPVYIRTGAIYATRRKIIEGGSLWGARSLPYIMPKERSVNVNDEIDFLLAEKLLSEGWSDRLRTLQPVFYFIR